MKKVTILAYHSVSDGKTPISVTTKEFGEQMEFLKNNGFNVLNLSEYIEVVEGKKKLQKNSILITFDDAYGDVYQNALPILKKYGFSAVVSVNPFLVGKKAIFATREADKERDICSLEELRELSENNVAIVNHGFSHKDLPKLNDGEISFEYLEAKKWIENNIKSNSYPEVFVFPHGSKDARSISVIEKLGAKLIFKERVDVYPEKSLEYFKWSLNPVFQLARLNKKFIVIASVLVLIHTILGILVLNNIPNVNLPPDFFVVTGGDDLAYVRASNGILSGNLFSDINFIGYPLFIALVSLITGITTLPSLALPLFIANIFLFSSAVTVLTMLIIKKIWHKNSYAFFGGMFTIVLPYLWYFTFKDLSFVTYGGNIDPIGLVRSLQLFGLTVGSDWLSTFLAIFAIYMFLKEKWSASGLLFGLSFLVRAQNVSFLVLLSLLLLFSAKIKPFLKFGIAGFIGGFLQLLHNFMITGSPFVFAAYSPKYNPAMEIDGAKLTNIIKLPLLIISKTPDYLFIPLILFFGLLCAGTFFALRYFWRKKQMFYLFLITGIIIPLSLFSTIPTIRNPRYFLPFIPIFLIFIIANYEVFFLRKKSYSV